MRGRISFEKVDLKQLDRNNTHVDMHTHTQYSFDSMALIPNIVKRMRKFGYGIAVTDHDTIKGAEKLAQYKDILTIPGIEVRCDRGFHTLLYFYDLSSLQEFHHMYVQPAVAHHSYPTIHEQLDYAKDFNCVSIIAHPYAPGPTALMSRMHNHIVDKKLLKQFDGVEVIQGCNLHGGNVKAIDLAHQHGGLFTGGSDGHTTSEHGHTLTHCEGQLGVEEFLDALRKKQNSVRGIGKPTVRSTLAQLGKVPPIVKNARVYVAQAKAILSRR